MKNLAEIRTDYVKAHLSRADLNKNPIRQFEKWMREAIASKVLEPSAMTLATVDSKGVPHIRVVLLKDVSDQGFTFFTNYESDKAMQISSNPHVAINFYWPELERQIRICGKVEKTSAEVSEKYFLSRPLNSRIGAWASPQSHVITDSWLESEVEKLKEQSAKYETKCPSFWGGYLVRPFELEFWQGRPSRLHDRFRYRLDENSMWIIERLAP